MRLIKPSVEIIPQALGLEGVYKQIELAGRTCYKSENRITEDSAKEFVDRMISSNHCYTSTSQVLTENGWMNWSSYNGERVAVVDSNGVFVGFEEPKRIIRHKYTGNFYYYPSLGMEVTDGHRMYGIFRENKNDFYNSNLYSTFVCGQPYKDNNGRSKTLGERMFKVPKHCRKPIQTDPFYELIGFWLGDGCHSLTVDKLVFHLKKRRKIEYLETLCRELGYTFEISKSNYYKVCKPRIGANFNQLFYREGKYLPKMFIAENPTAAKSIIVGLMNSDGTSATNTKTVTFTNTSKSIIEWIQDVAPIAGFAVSFNGVCHETSAHNAVYKVSLLDTNYTINNDSRNPDSKVRITNRTEDVYCVTVSTGLILIRGDNGVTSICGNCAMLEHGTVYLQLIGSCLDPKDTEVAYGNYCVSHYINNKYSKTKIVSNDRWSSNVYITTNLRVLVENEWLDDLKYLCEPTEHHEKRITVKFICDRGVSHEFVRHRVFSFAQESTRYCNYSKDKFNGMITYIKPSWITNPDLEGSIFYNDETDEWFSESTSFIEMNTTEQMFIESISRSEEDYLALLYCEQTPQQARAILPNALKTELVMTGFLSDWKHFFELRCDKKAHPDARVLANQLKEQFIEKGWITK